MQPNKIVMHFKDGRILKGSTSDFFPNKKAFHVGHLDGRIEEVEVESLKGLFFVKNVDGDRDYQYKYNDLIAGAGRKVWVNFNDGETIIGYVLGLSPDRPGFILTPADSQGNNERIYIVKSATKKIDFSAREEKRRYYRAGTANLISYEFIHDYDNSVEHGMGETLDISQGGLLIETRSAIRSKYILLTATDSKEELLNIKGEVVYCRQQGPDKYHTGIRFIETTEAIRRIVVEMVKAFLQTKTNAE